MLMVDVLRHP